MKHSVEFLYQIKESVRIPAIDTDGFVEGLMLFQSGPEYRVVWWLEGVRYSQWLSEHELAPIGATK